MRTLIGALLALAIVCACHPTRPNMPVEDASVLLSRCEAACAVIPASCHEHAPDCAETCQDLLEGAVGGFDPDCIMSNANDAGALAEHCGICH